MIETVRIPDEMKDLWERAREQAKQAKDNDALLKVIMYNWGSWMHEHFCKDKFRKLAQQGPNWSLPEDFPSDISAEKTLELIKLIYKQAMSDAFLAMCGDVGPVMRRFEEHPVECAQRGDLNDYEKHQLAYYTG